MYVCMRICYSQEVDQVSKNLFEAMMNLLRVRDEIERQTRKVLTEMDRKGELLEELPTLIAAALER